MNRYLVTAALLLLTACGDIASPTHVACDAFLLQFGPVSGDTIHAANGLAYIDIRVGAGAVAAAGTTVDVNYSGYLVNGTRFDTSCPGGRTVLRFRIGGSEMIAGMELGVVGMQPGGVRRLIIPPSLGYRDQPVGPIPPNSTLIFDVQLVGLPGR
jgi:FKBP-type peptidyl-prolyl cis-trans isomerase